MLLVEDNVQVRTFAEQLLSDLQCWTLVASTGEEALAMLEQEHVDVVFTDVVMPGLSGIELAAALGRTRPELPVVLATGYSPDVVANNASGHEIVRKPYHAHSVSAALARVVAKSRNRAA